MWLPHSQPADELASELRSNTLRFLGPHVQSILWLACQLSIPTGTGPAGPITREQWRRKPQRWCRQAAGDRPELPRPELTDIDRGLGEYQGHAQQSGLGSRVETHHRSPN